MFAAAIMLPAVGYTYWRWGAVFSFWFAYVLTRPLGASVADWLGKPSAEGGLGVGSGWVSLGFAIIMIVLVAVMYVRPQTSTALASREAPRARVG